MDTLLQDAKYGIRLLVKSPAFALIAVLTLALAIGANTAIFSVVNAVLLRKLPYAEPNRLVRLYEERTKENVQRNPVAPADYLDWRAQNGVFESMAAYAPGGFSISGGTGQPQSVFGVYGSADLFRTMGVTPILGRGFASDEDQPGHDTVVVISSGLWERMFAADRNVIGRKVMLDGAPATIIGVMPSKFVFPTSDFQLWTPLVFSAEQAANRGMHSYDVVARLKPGISLARAQGDMKAIGARLEAAHQDTNVGHTVNVFPLYDEVVTDVRRPLLVLLGAVGLVLLIACGNVANLVLARDSARIREFAVRAALGAARSRIIRQCLTESLLLSLLSGILGMLLASWGIGAISALLPKHILPSEDIRPDRIVMGFCIGLSLLTAFVFGLVPAFSVQRSSVNEPLKEGARGTSSSLGLFRLRGVLAVVQVSLALTLLSGAGLLIRSFLRVQRVDPGFETSSAVTFGVSLPDTRYNKPEQRSDFYQKLLENVATLPGVTSAGAINFLPVGGGDARRGIWVEGRDPGPEPTRAHPRVVTAGYFSTMQIPIRRGRAFTEADRRGAPLVVMVNETLVRRFFPGRDPLGKHLALGGDTTRQFEIVGVVGDVKHWGLENQVNPEMYFSMLQTSPYQMSIIVRSAGDPESLSTPLRKLVTSLDPELPAATVTPLEDVVSESVRPRRFNTILLGTFSGIALLLAVIGVYGVISYATAQRTREFGIRMALGARARDVFHLVLGSGMAMVGVGIVLGLAGGLAASQLLRKLLFEVKPFDPVTYAVTALAIASAAALACYLPARRATRVEPLEALRYE